MKSDLKTIAKGVATAMPMKSVATKSATTGTKRKSASKVKFPKSDVKKKLVFAPPKRKHAARLNSSPKRKLAGLRKTIRKNKVKKRHRNAHKSKIKKASRVLARRRGGRRNR